MNINDIFGQMNGFINFGDETEYTVDIYIGDAIVQTVKINGSIQTQSEIQNVIIQLVQDPRPMKVVCSRDYFDKFGENNKPESFTFENKAMISGKSN